MLGIRKPPLRVYTLPATPPHCPACNAAKERGVPWRYECPSVWRHTGTETWWRLWVLCDPPTPRLRAHTEAV